MCTCVCVFVCVYVCLCAKIFGVHLCQGVAFLCVQLLDPDFIFEVAPSILQPLSTVSVPVGGTAVIKCRVCGRPRPAIAWTGPDQKVIVSSSSCDLTLSYSDDGTAMIEVS